MATDINQGDLFNSHDDFVNAVKSYARKTGFSVRLGKVEKKKDNTIRKRTIICSRAGVPDKKDLDTLKQVRDRATQRCNCSFYVRASLSPDDGLWHIINLNLGHNHIMVDQAHQHFMLTERFIPDDVKQRILLLRKAGVKISLIRDILKEEFGERVTWFYNDLYNFIYNLEDLQQKEFDAENFLELLNQIKEENDEFVYYIHINPDSQRLERVIWMYPEQKIHYSRFYDVVVFDNTYKCNRFKMPLGIFTGVNNFGQSICFAGTLVIEEDEETFKWIFSKFLEMVNNNAPSVLLTDDDKAMGNAYMKVLKPHGTRHRLCQWHLLKNVMKNLIGKLGNTWQSFIGKLYKCLGKLDLNDFQIEWDDLKALYPAASSYLLRMEKVKEKWAACFNLDIFMADMITTQRAESMNNLMKKYLDASTSLMEFISAFESVLDTRKDNTEFLEYKQKNYNIIFKTNSPFEKQAALLLTSYSLKKTQEQIIESYSYKCEEIGCEENIKAFKVIRYGKENSLGRIVKYFTESKWFKCSCGYTQMSGFICRHIFRTGIQLNLNELPSELYLYRWRKDPDDHVIFEHYKDFYSNVESHGLTSELNSQPITFLQNEEYQFKLTRLLQEIQRLVKHNPEISMKLYASINNIYNEEISSISNYRAKESGSSQEPKVKNPLVIKTRGRPSNKRVKSSLEKPGKGKKIRQNI